MGKYIVKYCFHSCEIVASVLKSVFSPLNLLWEEAELKNSGCFLVCVSFCFCFFSIFIKHITLSQKIALCIYFFSVQL